MKNITELNELINVGVKLVCGKIGVPLKTTNRILDKISTITSNNDKTRKNHGNMLRQKAKSHTSKNANKTRGNKPESTGKRREIKKISRKSKTMLIKQAVTNQQKTFYMQYGGDGTKTYQLQGEQNNFGAKYGNHAEWISRVRRTRRMNESENTHRFTQNNTKTYQTGKRDLKRLAVTQSPEENHQLMLVTLKKYQTGKRQAMMEYMVSGSKIHFHPWQTSTRNE